jgi:hypothetical protein
MASRTVLILTLLSLAGCEPARPGVGRPSPMDSSCNDACAYARDGECDDGGPRALTSLCMLGTDCADCGRREPATPTTDAMPACIAAGGLCAYSADCCGGLFCLVPAGSSILDTDPVCRTCYGSGSSCIDGGDCCSSACRESTCD